MIEEVGSLFKLNQIVIELEKLVLFSLDEMWKTHLLPRSTIRDY